MGYDPSAWLWLESKWLRMMDGDHDDDNLDHHHRSPHHPVCNPHYSVMDARSRPVAMLYTGKEAICPHASSTGFRDPWHPLLLSSQTLCDHLCLPACNTYILHLPCAELPYFKLRIRKKFALVIIQKFVLVATLSNLPVMTSSFSLFVSLRRTRRYLS